MKFLASHKLIAIAAIPAFLSACGGGTGAVDSAVNAQVVSAPAIVTLGQSFVVSGLAISKPNLMAATAWSVTKLTTGAPDLLVTNADCAVTLKDNKTVNAATATPTSMSTWSCAAVFVAPTSLAADSSYRVTYLATDALGNTGTSSRDFTISHGAVGPVADAPVVTTPKSISVVSGTQVNLNCTASGGTVGATSAYRIQWVTKSNMQGVPLSLSNPNAQTVAFKAPAVSSHADVVFQCRVTDDNLLTSVSETAVTITPAAAISAIANAGGSQTTTPGSVVTLNGLTSTPNTGLFYTWTQTGGPAVSLAGANTAQPTFIAPAAAASTRYTFQLVAQATYGTQDSAAPSEIDTAVVYVNQQPSLVLIMSAASVIRSGVATTLTVTVTPTTSPLFYEWTKVSGPAVPLGGANTSAASFVAPSVSSATPMVFSVKVSRSPIATAAQSEIYSSDVVVSVSP